MLCVFLFCQIFTNVGSNFTLTCLNSTQIVYTKKKDIYVLGQRVV